MVLSSQDFIMATSIFRENMLLIIKCGVSNGGWLGVDYLFLVSFSGVSGWLSLWLNGYMDELWKNMEENMEECNL